MIGWDIPGMLLVTLISNIKLVLLTDTGFPSDHYKAAESRKKRLIEAREGLLGSKYNSGLYIHLFSLNLMALVLNKKFKHLLCNHGKHQQKSSYLYAKVT